MATKPTRKNALLPFEYGDIRDCMCALLSNKMFTTSGTESADKPAARPRRHSTKLLCRRLLIWSRHAGGGDMATRADLRNSRVGTTKVEQVVRKPPWVDLGYSKGRPRFQQILGCNNKTLGIVWNPKEDKLQGRATPYEQGTITKRVMCSELAKIFTRVTMPYNDSSKNIYAATMAKIVRLRYWIGQGRYNPLADISKW